MQASPRYPSPPARRQTTVAASAASKAPAPFGQSGGMNKEIAGALNMSESTVRSHREHVFAKLGVHDAPGVTRWVIKHGRSWRTSTVTVSRGWSEGRRLKRGCVFMRGDLWFRYRLWSTGRAAVEGCTAPGASGALHLEGWTSNGVTRGRRMAGGGGWWCLFQTRFRLKPSHRGRGRCVLRC
jgi:hypothetical protein